MPRRCISTSAASFLAEVLEVYRLCARLDNEDPLAIVRDRGVGKDWLKRMDYPAKA